MTFVNHPRPTFSLDEAAEVLRQRFGVVGRLDGLPSERDQNFDVRADDGQSFILKIVNAAEPLTAIEFQTALLRHVEINDPSLPTPRVVPTRDGLEFGLLTGRGGERHCVRLVSYLPGTPLAEVAKTPETLRDIGRVLGQLDRVLGSFGHPGAHVAFDWEIRETPRARQRLSHVADAAQRRCLEQVLDTYDSRVAPTLGRLRHGVIHNDANDWNLLVADPAQGAIAGLIDFGDAAHSPLIAELAVACTYAMLDEKSPIETAAVIAAGYHAELPLQDAEFDILLDLIAARLAVSVSISATRHAEAIENPYLLVSEGPAWNLLERLGKVDRRIATAILRNACSLESTPGAGRLRGWLAENRRTLAPLMHPHPARQQKHVVDLGNPEAPLARASAAQDHAAADRAYADLQREHGFTLGLGPYGELRTVYTAPFFDSTLIDGVRRNIHLGLDIFAPAGTPLFTPLPAKVVAATINPAPQDYGGLLLLEHEPEPGLRFRSLWGHLDHASVRDRHVGEELPAGTCVARLGDYAENGGWIPHLHLQLVASDYDDVSVIPGVGEAAFRGVWNDLFPSPYDFAGLPSETFDRTGQERDALQAARKKRLAPNLSLSYRRPLKMVRGEDVWLIDETGRAHLDCYNNVAHIGHCHPRVVDAITRQAQRLNTNTRYLHDNIIDYTERLAKTLPGELDTFFVVCTGSEANELALRAARAYTRRRDMVVLDWAYHGHTQGLIDISPYKFKRKGGSGRPEHTHVLPVADPYRAPAEWPDGEIGKRYGEHACEIIDRLVKDGNAPAAFIAETIPSVAGQVFLPPGYLGAVYDAVRRTGGLCIADEVQVGFGRVGRSMWAFEEHGVVPDIVTMGKPIGNGHPLAVVAMRREVAEGFANGMEYFNTFGGNPVSCAAGAAVLDVLEDEHLLLNAVEQGDYLLAGMRKLMDRYSIVGDVRGRGLFLGLELVRDRATKEHAGEPASAIVNRARELGVLMGTDGPFDNVIKLRPPMTFRREHADILLETLDEAMRNTLG